MSLLTDREARDWMDRANAAEARQQALVNRVAVLERALERIENLSYGTRSPVLNQIDEIAREAIDAS